MSVLAGAGLTFRASAVLNELPAARLIRENLAADLEDQRLHL